MLARVLMPAGTACPRLRTAESLRRNQTHVASHVSGIGPALLDVAFLVDWLMSRSGEPS
jgi:hypothetical protein